MSIVGGKFIKEGIRKMKIWAHRGCSQRYPENTITAFAKAIDIPRLTGIELDIQMTKDGEIVVLHDERVDRTTDGMGYVKDFLYTQLRELKIETDESKKEKIPSIHEVLDLLQVKMKEGMFLNIELKNSSIFYDGMEEKILELIAKRGLQKQTVYSSFSLKSMQVLRKLDPDVSVGILDTQISECLYKKNCISMAEDMRIALHPFRGGLDLPKDQFDGQVVRAWFIGHLYPERPTGTRLDLESLEERGITDVFLNEPELYLK